MFSKLFTMLSIAIAALFAATPAYARIVGINAPSTPLSAGQNFTVSLTTASYIQNNLQYYVIFGLAPPTFPQGSLFELLGTGYDLVANNQSNTGSGAFNVSVTVPAGFTPSSPNALYTLTAAVFGTVGASEEIWVNYWSTNVTVA